MKRQVKATLRWSRASQPRAAVTLVELLIVMAVVLLLAGLTLPSFRSMLQDQRVSQTARIVQGMTESARARAIALGRPVALILDRVPVDTAANASDNLISDNTCTRMSIGEVFPPYEGDWSGATGDLSDDSTDADSVPETLTIDLAKVASMIDMSTSKPNGMIEVGDLLQLGDHSQLFSITNISVQTINGALKVQVRFANPPPGFYASDALWLTASQGIRFRMIRRPTKTLAGSTVLPRGMCIDLSQSGVGVSGNELAAAKAGTMNYAGLYGPIFIVFNARGNVDGAYYRTSGGSSMAQMNPTGIIHLLVARTEQVAVEEMNLNSARESAVPNLFDVRNVWVSINPFSGAIYSSPNAAVSMSPTTTIATAADRKAARTFATNVLDARGS